MTTETSSVTKLRRRTWISFTVLFSFMFVFTLLWAWMLNQPEQDETPAPFRRVLELNGKIWKSLFNPLLVSECTPPQPGKIPRVNGDIGLSEDFDPVHWNLEVVEDDQDPNSRHFTVSMKDLVALERTETSTEFKCIEGWSEDMSFAGVKFSDFMKAYNLKSQPYVGLVSSDGEYYVSIDLESMLHRQTLLAYEMNGRALLPANGAPLRLVIPVKYGIKNLKRIGKIFFSNRRPPDYWAERGYDWYAGL